MTGYVDPKKILKNALRDNVVAPVVIGFEQNGKSLYLASAVPEPERVIAQLRDAADWLEARVIVDA